MNLTGALPAKRLTATFSLAIALMGLTLTGCVRSPTTDGQLAAGGDAGQLCLPSSTNGEYTFGNQPLTNNGAEPVTIRSVNLLGAQDVDIVDALLVPVGSTLLGSTRGWPPAPDRLPQDLDWTSRLPAAGTAIPAGQVRNLVLHLRTRGDSQFDAVEVAYSDASGDRALASSTTKVRFRTQCT